MYTLIVISVVAFFVLCEAANVAKRNESCGELRMCMAPFDSFEIGVVSSFSNLTDDEHYDQLCQANTDFQSCIADKKDDCNVTTVLSIITGSAQMLNYLCSYEGKEGLQKIADSPCVTNKTTLFTAQESLADCVKNFRQNFEIALNADGEGFQTVCQVFDQQIDCIESSMTDHCGSDFGSLTNKIWRMAYNPLAAEVSCVLQVTQIRIFKARILPLVLAGAKRRR